jgi:hypothetical protein
MSLAVSGLKAIHCAGDSAPEKAAIDCVGYNS